MANNVAIIDTGPEMSNTLAMINTAIDNPVTTTSLQAAGNEKNAFDNKTLMAATTAATPANATAVYGAPRKVVTNSAANNGAVRTQKV